MSKYTNSLNNQELQHQSDFNNTLVQTPLNNGKTQNTSQLDVKHNYQKKTSLLKRKESNEKSINQSHVTFIQQNIYCSLKGNMINNIDNYTLNNTNVIVQNNNYNPNDLSLMKQDEEEKAKILNTYFSELKNPMTNTGQSELLHIKAFLLHTKKNKITSITESNNVIAGYSAYSYKNQKQHQEDRMNITSSKKNNRNISFYSIFDGHGGTETADLLSQSFHNNLLNSTILFKDKNNAILTEINRIEEQLTNDFVNKNKNKDNKDLRSSGSCALILMAIDDIMTIIHIGDSRGILSMNKGKNVYSLSIDHHPSLESEKMRILNNGGDIKFDNRSKTSKTKRVFPGGLAISRSIGDIEAKLPAYGGKANVIIGIPDVISFKFKKDFDFIVLCCDGISDKVSNREVCLIIYQTLIKCIDKIFSYEQLIQKCTINIMKNAIIKGSKDNLTCIFICFDSFKNLFETRNKAPIEDSINYLNNAMINCDNVYNDLESEYFLNKEKLKINPQKTGINCNQKSILNSNNIVIDTSGLSFQESNISLEGKKSNWKKEEAKRKKRKKANSICCGFFS